MTINHLVPVPPNPEVAECVSVTMAQSPKQCTSWLHSMYRGGEGGVSLRCPGLLGQCEWHKWGDNSGLYGPGAKWLTNTLWSQANMTKTSRHCARKYNKINTLKHRISSTKIMCNKGKDPVDLKVLNITKSQQLQTNHVVYCGIWLMYMKH